MEHTPSRTILSVLRTVLYLMESDPAIPPDSASVLEFRRATLKLIAEIQAARGVEEEYIRPRLDRVDSMSK